MVENDGAERDMRRRKVQGGGGEHEIIADKPSISLKDHWRIPQIMWRIGKDLIRATSRDR
jgi:hypothetical protein